MDSSIVDAGATGVPPTGPLTKATNTINNDIAALPSVASLPQGTQVDDEVQGIYSQVLGNITSIETNEFDLAAYIEPQLQTILVKDFKATDSELKAIVKEDEALVKANDAHKVNAKSVKADEASIEADRTALEYDNEEIEQILDVYYYQILPPQ